MVVGLSGLGEAIASPFQRSVIALELKDSEEQGRLVVAVKDDLRPLGFRNEVNELVGLEIDIARRLATELYGTPDALVLEPVSNSERIPALLRGDVDLIIARLGVTEARSRLVNFSTPYYFDGTAFVTRRSEVQELSDLSNATVAVLRYSTTIDIVRSLIPDVLLVGVDSYQEALALLDAGEADAFAADASVLTGWVQEYPAYHVVLPMISAEGLAIALPRGLQHEELRQTVNESLERWQQEGWLQERLNYWGLP